MTPPDPTADLPRSTTPDTLDAPTRLAREARFLAWLPTIERVIAVTSARHALDGHEKDEFATWATARLIQNDYAIIAKFGERASVATFLSVVVGNLLRDYRNSVWGRWRPSAAALRMGPIGVRLEELIVRDKCAVREAINIVRSAGATESEARLTQMAAQLARRVTDSDVPLEHASDQPASLRADGVASSDERARITQVLRAALDELPDEDRLITRLRFWDGVSVADIARVLHMEQKPLYRRVEGILRRLMGILTRYKVSEADVLDLLAEETLW